MKESDRSKDTAPFGTEKWQTGAKRRHVLFARHAAMKISSKIILSLVSVTVLCSLLIGTVGIVNIVKISNTSTSIYNNNLVPLTSLYKISTNFLALETELRDVAIGKSKTDFMTVDHTEDTIIQQLKMFSKSESSARNQAYIKQMVDDIARMQNDGQTVNSYCLMNDTDGAYKLLYGDMQKTSDDFVSTINKIYDSESNAAKTTNHSNVINFYIALLLMAGIMLLATVLAVLLGSANARAIGRPLGRLVEAADRIASGQLDVEVDTSARDETGILARAFQKISDSLHLLNADVNTLIEGAIAGNLETRADITRHQGAYREIIDGVNKSLDAIVEPLNTTADYIGRISRGEIPESVTEEFKGDFNRIKKNLNVCFAAIRKLIADADMLSQAAVEGNLSVRADVTRHEGDYCRIIEGINSTLDTILMPIGTAADVIDKISRGEIPEPITEEFKGDFNKIKQNLNICIGTIQRLIADADMLAQAAQSGNLSARADASKHQGGYRSIILGVNNTLDAIVGPLNVAADYIDMIGKGSIPPKLTEDFRGDFNKIKQNLNLCIDAMNGLIADANMLADAAGEGTLSVRADAGRHHGDLKRIIEGVNNTLDSFIGPVEESASVLGEVAKGNLNVRVKGDYKGDLAQIKNALNETVTSLSGYIEEISGVLAEVSEGNLDVTIQSSFKGDFVAIRDSINRIIDSFNVMLLEIITASDEVAAGAHQVSDGSQLLSQGALEQASALESLTSAISLVASQTKQNAANAGRASGITERVREQAEQGNGQMGQMLTAMDEIGKSSENINSIIKVIDSISFQTNILALNAAVEAARAGQAGKGFAVVAEEVRNLATRSADAARETADLIQNSIEKSRFGMEIAQKTAKSLNEIVSSAEEAARLVGEISASSAEQADGIGQINDSVDKVSLVVQSNSATAEQSAASSQELSSQSELLKEKVNRFRLRARRVSD